MRTLTLTAVLLSFVVAGCAGTGAVIPQEQAAQYQQAGDPFPYNSFYCP
jgi:hypothetical protein